VLSLSGVMIDVGVFGGKGTVGSERSARMEKSVVILLMVQLVLIDHVMLAVMEAGLLSSS